MKSRTFLLMMLCVAATCMMHAQNVQGTWKLIGSSGNPLPEGYTNIRLMTPTHFIWTLSDKEGNIISGAGGTYTMSSNTYTETILYTLPGMKSWKGKKATYKVDFEGKKVKFEGHLEFDKDRKVMNAETWLKID